MVGASLGKTKPYVSVLQLLNLEFIMNISENSNYIYRKVGLKDGNPRHRCQGALIEVELRLLCLVMLCPAAAMILLRP